MNHGFTSFLLYIFSLTPSIQQQEKIVFCATSSKKLLAALYLVDFFCLFVCFYLFGWLFVVFCLTELECVLVNIPSKYKNVNIIRDKSYFSKIILINIGKVHQLLGL